MRKEGRKEGACVHAPTSRLAVQVLASRTLSPVHVLMLTLSLPCNFFGL